VRDEILKLTSVICLFYIREMQGEHTLRGVPVLKHQAIKAYGGWR
jgi:hypothetical protein